MYAINSSLVNEFRYSFVRQGNWFVPQSLGKGFPAQLGFQFSTVDEFPSCEYQWNRRPRRAWVRHERSLY